MLQEQIIQLQPRLQEQQEKNVLMSAELEVRSSEAQATEKLLAADQALAQEQKDEVKVLK